MLFTTEFSHEGEPHVWLNRRLWDDHGYSCLFEAILREGGREQWLGTVKILQRGEKTTQLPSSFTTLPANYCSLGQSVSYDDRLDLAFRRALRDLRCLSDPERLTFEQEPGFERSLLRFASARFLYEKALERLSDELCVSLRVLLAGFEEPHRFDLALDPSRSFGRLAVIIGENGTGKTRLLNDIAKALAGIETKWLPAGMPSVSRVVALSCNAFDQFDIPRPVIEDTYFYIGLRSTAGVINIDTATRKAVSVALEQIRADAKRFAVWREVMDLVGLHELIELDPGRLHREVRRLGAGYKFVWFIMTKLVRVIEERSFVLFDEPENHTHPRLLSRLMRALHLILDRFESFALAVTHSPLVLQEVPARQALILRCHEPGFPQLDRPEIETFGASFGELLRMSFSIDYRERNFDLRLRELVERRGVKQVREELGEELSLAVTLLLDKLEGNAL